MAFTLPGEEELKKIKKEKEDKEVGFFTSALAGVATGLWNIPKGVFSLGATVFDLVGDTNVARDVEKWFDDVNPWDDEAEARTIGKLTGALAQIAIPAGIGWKLGSAGMKAWQAKNAASLAKNAIAAKRAGKYFSLANAGNLIAKTPGRAKLVGGVLGGGVGEMVVADEDIGTFADMAQGTSLEKYALTMMDKNQDLRGREDAMRRLVNRLKFGTEGAVFNLALIGAGKGIKKLRRPAKEGLDEYSKNKLKSWAQKYGEFGFTARGTGTVATHEAKEASKGIQKAVAIEATNLVNDLDDAFKDVGEQFYDQFLNAKNSLKTETRSGQELAMKELQEIMSPTNFKEQRLLSKEVVASRLEQMKPIMKYKQLQKDLIELATQKAGALSDEGLEASLKGIRDDFKSIKTAVPNIEKLVKLYDKRGIFQLKDYQTTKLFDDFLKKVTDAGGDTQKVKKAVFRMRRAIDNMSGKLLQHQMPEEIATTLKENFGRYLHTVYRQYEQRGFWGLGKYKVTQQILDRSTELLYNSKLQGFANARVNKLIKSAIEPTVEKRVAEALAKGKPLSAKQIENLTKKTREAFMTEQKGMIGGWKEQAVREVDQLAKNPDWVRRTEDATRSEVDDYAKRIANDEVDPRDLATSDIGKDELRNIKVTDGILRKKVLEPWQQELFGVIKDPSYTFFATIGKQANLNSTLRYMDDIAKIGSQGENPFIQTADNLTKKGIDINDTTKWRLVENSAKVPTPLDGKYIKAPMYDSIFDTQSGWLNTTGPMSHVGSFYKTVILAPKAGSQIAKTILSPLTHVRNALSAGAFVAANGAFFPLYGDIQLLRPFGKESIWKKAYSISGKRVLGTMEAADEELYKRLVKTGVVDSQVQATETKRLLKDILRDPAAVDRNLVTKMPKQVGVEVKRKALKAFGKLQDAYIAEDDFWKVINWHLERNRYGKIIEEVGINKDNFKHIINSKLPRQLDESAEAFLARQTKGREAIKALGENGDRIATYFSDLAQRRGYIDEGINAGQQFSNFLDEIAGNLTRNQIPNYGYVGKTAQALRQSPFGNFIAFPLEIMRTGNNIIERSIIDMQSGIPQIEKLGYKRLGSFGATVVGVPAAVVGAAKGYHDVDDEEMDALRKMVPEWSKNSTLVPMGRDKDGYLQYIDFSYSNAYDTLIRPVMAVYRGLSEAGVNQQSLTASLGHGMMDSMTEILKPYATESIYTEALIDSVFRVGVGKGGRRVWSQEDDFGQKLFKGVAHIAGSLAPGSVKQFKRIGQAVTGTTDDYGKSFNLSDEIHGLYGMRGINSDPERAMKYKTTAFGSRLKKADNLFIAPLLKGGRVTPENIVDRYKYSESRRFAVIKEMYEDLEAAKTLGVPLPKLRRELEKRKGLKRDVINSIFRGVYTPQEPSSFFQNKIREINRDLNEVEGLNIDNPWLIARPFVRDIINENRNISLADDFINFPEVKIPDPSGPLSLKMQSMIPASMMPSGSGGGGGITPYPNIVEASAFNRGTGNEQVNQLTGLTYVEDSLLKPWEKAYRIKQNQKRT